MSTPRGYDIGFRAGVHDSPLEDTVRQILEPLDARIEELNGRIAADDRALSAGLAALHEAANSLRDALRESRTIAAEIAAAAMNEHHEAEPDWRWPITGTTGLLLSWWAIAALLHPFVSLEMAGAERIRVAFAFLCTSGVFAMGLASWRSNSLKRARESWRRDSLSLTFYTLAALSTILSLYLALSSESRPVLFGALALTSLAVAVLGWGTFSWQQSGAVCAYLERNAATVQATETQHAAALRLLDRLSDEGSAVTARLRDLESEIRRLEAERFALKRVITEAYRLGQSVR